MISQFIVQISFEATADDPSRSLSPESESVLITEALKVHKKSEIKRSLKPDKQSQEQSNGIIGKRKRENVDTPADDEFIRKQDKVAKLTEPTSQITLDDSIDGSIVVGD